MPAGGQEITGQQGSFGSPQHTQLLRSRKDGLGSATAELTGQSVSGQQGSLGRTRTKALTGGSMSSQGGLLVPSSTSSGLPSWRVAMAENTRIDLSLNTQASVDPELSSSLNPNFPGNAPWRGNSGYGGAFAYGNLYYASELGQYGSIVGTIGGHNGYWGNEVVRFDITLRQFAHLSRPYSSNSHPGSFFVKPNEGHGDRFNGELFIDSNFNTDQTQPCSYHSYSSNVVLPPDASIGVGPSGALISTVRAGRYLDGVSAASHSHRSHKFDLGQTNPATAAWERFSTNLFEDGADRSSFGWAVYDPTRKKIFAGIRAALYNQLFVLNCVTRAWESNISLSQNVTMFDTGAWHWTANPDYIINFVKGSGGYVLELINVSTGQVSTPGTTGTGPSIKGGYDFVQSVNKMAAYEGGTTTDDTGSGGLVNRVWILTPPSTTNSAVFTTTPWTWTFEDVTGPTPPAQTVNGSIPHIGRFVWAEKVKCFIWWANGINNVQAWHVRGFDTSSGGGTPTAGRFLISGIPITQIGTGTQLQNGETDWIWVSKGYHGTFQTWDNLWVTRNHVQGETVLDMNSVATIAVGDKVGFQANSQIYTVTNVNSGASQITVSPAVTSQTLKRRALMGRGGNWFDSTGTFRGTNHYINQTVSTQVVTVNISAIDGDLFIPAPINIASVKIDGVPVSTPNGAFYVRHGGPTGSVGFPTTPDGNNFVLNRSGGTTLEITRTSSATQQLIINKVATPEIPDYSEWNNPATGAAADLFSFDFTSLAAITSNFTERAGPYDTTFYTHSSGMPMMRFSINAENVSSGQFLGMDLGNNLPTGHDEIFMQYTWMYEPGAFDGFREAGMKMPGVQARVNGSAVYGDRMQHTSRNLGNQRMFGMKDYAFSVESPTSTDILTENAEGFRRVPYNIPLQPNTLYTFTQQSKMNTPGLKDGIRRLWINGHLVFEMLDYNFRGSDGTKKWNGFNVLWFAGGNTYLPLTDLFYHQGRVLLSTQMIGTPPELMP